MGAVVGNQATAVWHCDKDHNCMLHNNKDPPCVLQIIKTPMDAFTRTLIEYFNKDPNWLQQGPLLYAINKDHN